MPGWIGVVDWIARTIGIGIDAALTERTKTVGSCEAAQYGAVEPISIAQMIAVEEHRFAFAIVTKQAGIVGISRLLPMRTIGQGVGRIAAVNAEDGSAGIST